MMRIVTTFILLSSLVAIHPTAAAQENTDPAEATTQAQADANSGSAPTPGSKTSQTTSLDTSSKTTASTTAKAAGNYNPTEEISDDLSVSFPVDI
ncbi:hypothetical protein R50072_22880 [Simiduia litorea]|uniref:hypothetical protein n=1 Tax=Simiduia litorea TaxID=1435348 RepID=UPI0036F42D04